MLSALGAEDPSSNLGLPTKKRGFNTMHVLMAVRELTEKTVQRKNYFLEVAENPRGLATTHYFTNLNGNQLKLINAALSEHGHALERAEDGRFSFMHVIPKTGLANFQKDQLNRPDFDGITRLNNLVKYLRKHARRKKKK